MRAKHIIAAGLALLPATAFAGETVTYSYDAKGRLTQAAHAGGPASGVTSNYQFDAADNRTRVRVTGAVPQLIVVPLNGLTVIPLRPRG